MASSEDSERHEQITIKTIRQALLFWPVSPDYTLRPSLQPGRSWSGSVAVGMSACSNEVPPSAMTRPQGWACGCMLHADPLGSQTLVLDDGLRGWRVVRAPLLRLSVLGTSRHLLLPTCLRPAARASTADQPSSNRPQPWYQVASAARRARLVEQPHAPVRFPSNLVAYYDCTANLPHCFGP